MLLDQITSRRSRLAESACSIERDLHAPVCSSRLRPPADTIRLNDTEEHAHGLNPRNQ
ncbi:MAG: hypothetical protein JO372_21310 [Solirubrobacterales bacterium]|nr:hypothetical protein [Solirubrobacterales bacterium]